LIGESVERVKEGALQVDEAGRTINEVVSAVRRVTELMGEIAASSHEQHEGIEQVNQAVSQMDLVTQQNAALVEEAAAAAQSMTQHAGVLRDAVAVFRIEGSIATESGPATDAHSTAMRVSLEGKTIARQLAAHQRLAYPAAREEAVTARAERKAREEAWEAF
jgi:methyl-accepting chemotaxis protein